MFLVVLLPISVLRQEVKESGLLSQTSEQESSGGDGDHGSTGGGQHQASGLREDDSADGVHQDGGGPQGEVQQADSQGNRE